MELGLSTNCSGAREEGRSTRTGPSHTCLTGSPWPEPTRGAQPGWEGGSPQGVAHCSPGEADWLSRSLLDSDTSLVSLLLSPRTGDTLAQCEG